MQGYISRTNQISKTCQIVTQTLCHRKLRIQETKLQENPSSLKEIVKVTKGNANPLSRKAKNPGD